MDGISGPLGGIVRAELVVARVGHVSGAGPYGVLQTLPTDTDDGGTGLEEPFRFLLLFQKMTCCEIDILLVVSICTAVLARFRRVFVTLKTMLTLSEADKREAEISVAFHSQIMLCCDGQTERGSGRRGRARELECKKTAVKGKMK